MKTEIILNSPCTVMVQGKAFAVEERLAAYQVVGGVNAHQAYDGYPV